MTTRTPRVDFDSRYSDPQASRTDWQPAREVLATTELSWLTTVRPDGRPHTTPADHRLARRRRPLLYWTGGTQAQNLDANPTWCWQPARTLIPMAWMWCSRVRPYRSGTGKSSQIWQRLGWLSTGGMAIRRCGRRLSTQQRRGGRRRLSDRAENGVRVRQGSVQPDSLPVRLSCRSAPERGDNEPERCRQRARAGRHQAR